MECLEPLIGITRDQHNCEDAPVGYDTSYSGYYLDDDLDIKWHQDSGIFDDLARDKTDGINQFITDYAASLMNHNDKRYREWAGLLGQPKRNQALQNYADGEVGIRVKSGEIRGSVLVVHSVSYYSSVNGNSVQGRIVDGEDNEVGTFEVDKVAGAKTTHEFETPLVLPLTKNGQCVDYFFVYDTEGVAPQDIKVQAACCGRTRSKPYRKFADVWGFDATNDYLDTSQTSTYSFGLSIDAEFRCTFTDWLCQSVKKTLTPYMRVVSKTIQMYAANEFITRIINSNKINQFTLLRKENLYGIRNHNNKEIGDRLEWLAMNVPAEELDCANCKGSNRIKRRTIRV